MKFSTLCRGCESRAARLRDWWAAHAKRVAAAKAVRQQAKKRAEDKVARQKH